MTTAVQALYAWLTKHPNSVALLIGIGAVVVFGLLALGTAAVQGRTRAPQPKREPTAGGRNEPERRLRIVSAYWGIGGDARVDVTNKIQAHAQPDSINVPASIGILGDPYPGAVKSLTVTYSIDRQWEITVPENGYLLLPEKEGEEQSRKSAERMRAQLDKALSAVDIALDGASQLEYNLFIGAKGRFLSLRWCERLALKRLCDAGSMARVDLEHGLGSDCFESPDRIVAQLIRSDLVEETAGGRLRPKDVKWTDALLKDNPIC